LYYLRDLRGKAAKIREKRSDVEESTKTKSVAVAAEVAEQAEAPSEQA
jgi:hypothetical protein